MREYFYVRYLEKIWTGMLHLRKKAINVWQCILNWQKYCMRIRLCCLRGIRNRYVWNSAHMPTLCRYSEVTVISFVCLSFSKTESSLFTFFRGLFYLLCNTAIWSAHAALFGDMNEKGMSDGFYIWNVCETLTDKILFSICLERRDGNNLPLSIHLLHSSSAIATALSGF